jgi:competence protein ComEC
LESQVLKVAHHGSNSSTSPEFLARVNPRVAIVTGGAGGFGNLPRPETLERLRERGIGVFRSDVDGATTVQMGDRSLAVRCYGASPADSTTPSAGASAAGGLTFHVR